MRYHAHNCANLVGLNNDCLGLINVLLKLSCRQNTWFLKTRFVAVFFLALVLISVIAIELFTDRPVKHKEKKSLQAPLPTFCT